MQKFYIALNNHCSNHSLVVMHAMYLFSLNRLTTPICEERFLNAREQRSLVDETDMLVGFMVAM